MRAWQIMGHDHPPHLTQIAKPEPGPKELRVRIHACGLNFADLLMQQGRYQDMPALPFVPGMEYAGVVDALGPGASGPAVGTRVACYAGHGGLADYACLPAVQALPLPRGMSFAVGAAFPVAYGTSHLALTHVAPVGPGQTLLVLGAAGGVGLTAVEVGAALGARVIACARGAERQAIARAAGASVTLDSDSPTLRDDLRAMGGVDVVYDPVGGPAFDAALSATRPGGRVLVIGFASGQVPQIKANHLLVKNITVAGFWWGGYLGFAPDRLLDSLRSLIGWHSAGRLRPHIGHTLPLADLAQGLALLRDRQATGKVVITLT